MCFEIIKRTESANVTDVISCVLPVFPLCSVCSVTMRCIVTWRYDR